MILVRDVFQAKYGHGDELVKLFKEIYSMMAEGNSDVNATVMTDLSGPFFTIVTEIRMESMAAFEKYLHEGFERPEFGEWFAKTLPLTESGRREFYTIESTTG